MINKMLNNIHSYICDTEYKSKKTAGEEAFPIVGNASICEDKQVLGIGFLKSPNSKVHYGMRAEYAEDFSADNPIIKVIVQTGGGETEEYNINIDKIDTKNATEMEMFALCSYADANGMGTGGSFGSWQTLNYYRDNANHNGYFEMSNTINRFKTLKQDWMVMVSSMMKDYLNSGLYRQVLDGNKLLGIFGGYVGKN